MLMYARVWVIFLISIQRFLGHNFPRIYLCVCACVVNIFIGHFRHERQWKDMPSQVGKCFMMAEWQKQRRRSRRRRRKKQNKNKKETFSFPFSFVVCHGPFNYLNITHTPHGLPDQTIWVAGGRCGEGWIGSPKREETNYRRPNKQDSREFRPECVYRYRIAA